MVRSALGANDRVQVERHVRAFLALNAVPVPDDSDELRESYDIAAPVREIFPR